MMTSSAQRAAIAFLASITSVVSVGARAQNSLSNPSEEQICLVYYQYSHANVPYDDYAAHAPKVAQANEFKRKEFVDQERNRIKNLYDSVAGVKSVKINVLMSFSDYDESLGEYTMSGFGVNNYISYDCFGNTLHIQLQIENAIYAQSWSIKPLEAEQVLKKNKGSRNVIAVSTVDLTGAERLSANGTGILVGKLRDVTVIGQYTNVVLGKYTPPDR